MKKILILIGLLFLAALPATAQVALAPFTRAQYFDNSGKPLSGGLLWTYVSGTTTPLITYQDSLGTIPNSNPIVLDSAGRCNIWLTGGSYSFALFSSGGSLIWTENGISSSNIALLGLNNIWTGTNTWNGTATFNAGVTFNSGFTNIGPSNLQGGGSLAGTFSGSPLFAGMPNFSGGFLATTGTFSVGINSVLGAFSGQVSSTVPIGTAPFIITSTTEVPNLNANLLEGQDWASPGNIGTTLPASGTFTNVTDSALIAGNCVQTGALGILTTIAVPCGSTNTSLHQQNLASNVTVSATTSTTVDSYAIPSSSFTSCGTNLCRIRVAYSYYIAGGLNGICWVDDGVNKWAMSSSATPDNNFSTCAGGGYLSPTTWSAGSNPTITIKTINQGAVTVCMATAGSSPCNQGVSSSAPAINSTMQVEVVISN